jgi:hypothetical protein
MEIQIPIRQLPSPADRLKTNQYVDQPHTGSSHPTAGSSISWDYINKVVFCTEHYLPIVTPRGATRISPCKDVGSNSMYVKNVITLFITIRLIAETRMLK